MRYLVLVMAVLLVFATLPAFGSTFYLGGMSGNLYTPDDIILPVRNFETGFHDTFSALPDDDLMTSGLTYGLVPNLEVGLSIVRADSTKVTFNGKYRLVPETATVPGVTVGVWDAFGSATDTSAFLLLSKNITPYASKVTSTPSKPLKATLGFGSGVYKNVFAALHWTYSPKISLIGEYLGGEIGDRDNIFSAGIRYSFNNDFRLDLAAFDFDRLGVGFSYRRALK